MKMSRLFKKTLALMFVLFGVISILTSVLAAWILDRHMTEEYVSKGRAIARSIAGSSVEILLNRDAATIQTMIDEYLEIQGAAYVFVEDSKGNIISHTFVPTLPEAVKNLPADRHGLRLNAVEVPGVGDVIDITKPILAGVAGYVHVGMDMGLIRKYIWEAIWQMQALLFFIFWGSVLVLYMVVNRISRPLTVLTEYAQKLAAHDFSAAVDLDSRDEIGMLAGTMTSMAREISSLVQGLETKVAAATADLQETLAQMTAIIDNLADGLLVVDTEGTVVLSNPALADLFGFPDAPLTGRRATALFTGEVLALLELASVKGQVVSTAEAVLSRNRVGKAVGSTILKRVPGKEPVNLGAVILIRDITPEKELDRMKTDFISTVSHELRTPMTSILGFAKIIRKKLERAILPSLPGGREHLPRAALQVQENIDIIISEGKRLTELINDVLDISKMESGDMEWRREPVRMEEVVREAVAATSGLLSSKDLSMAVLTGQALPEVQGDPARLMQVMVNLISNAVKFTHEGGITCRVEAHGDGLLVSVQDTGVGVPAQEQDIIFEKFKQAGDTLTGKPVGTGLGLPICRQIVEHHGGRIWVESAPGRGSTFFFTLAARPGQVRDFRPGPGTAPPGRTARAVAPVDGQAPLIVVVDDDPALSAYLTQFLAEEGYRVAAAMDGVSAVNMARERMPALITMDLRMPGLSGRDAIRLLREDPATRNIPIIVITAQGEADPAGADAALGKPVDEGQLMDTIHGLLREGRIISKPCMVLKSNGENPQNRSLMVICPEKITFTAPEEVWSHIAQGFTGTVFMPAEVTHRVDLDRLSGTEGIQVVILPE